MRFDMIHLRNINKKLDLYIMYVTYKYILYFIYIMLIKTKVNENMIFGPYIFITKLFACE